MSGPATFPGRILALGTLAAVLLLASPATAYFETIEVGSRGLALGGAYEAAVDDVSASYWNPAALSLIGSPEFLFTFSRPYVVQDLNAGSVVAGGRFLGGGVAVSWTRTGVENVVSENMIGLSYGRWAYRDDRRTVYLGGTLLAGMVSYDPQAGAQGRDFGSKNKITGNVGLLWDEGEKVTFAGVLRHLGRPEFDFVGEEGGTKMDGGYALSVAYRWRPESTIMLSRTDYGGRVAWNYAGEIWFYDVFAIRAGIHDEEFAGGFGLRGLRWEVDATFLTHKNLGNTYRVSLLIRLPAKKEAGR